MADRDLLRQCDVLRGSGSGRVLGRRRAVSLELEPERLTEQRHHLHDTVARPGDAAHVLDRMGWSAVGGDVRGEW